MSIIERITQIMDTKNLNQSDLCKILGIKDSTFSTWKTRGTDPPAKYILLICEYLGVSVDYLLGRVDEPTATIKTVQGYITPHENHIKSQDNSLDGMEKEMIEEFKKLTFNDKVKVINLIAELNQKGA